jgi:hypothetical protein
MRMPRIVPIVIGSSVAFVLFLVGQPSARAEQPHPARPKAALDAGVARTSTIAKKPAAALSKEDIELARYMDVLQQDHELLKNLDVLKLLPALED